MTTTKAESIVTKEEDKKFNTFQAVVIAALTVLPAMDIFEYMKFGVVFALALMAITRNSEFFKKELISPLIMWLVNTVLAAIAVIAMEGTVSFPVILHEIQRVAYYLLLILLCNSMNLKLSTLANICKCLLLFHFVLQSMQYFNIGNTYSFLYNNYLDDKTVTTHLDMAYPQMLGGSDFRSGSIFLNPNVYVIYPCAFLLVFLQKTEGKIKILDYIWIAMSAVSMYYTGSRTGLILFAVLFVAFVFINKDKVSGFTKFVIPLALIVAYFYLSKSGARVTKVNEGLDNSIDVKTEGFQWYFAISNVLFWAVGSLGSSLRIAVDMEFGYVFCWWGVFGLVWYIKLIISIANANKEKFKYLARGMQIVIILSSISCSIILNMSVFPFICLMAFTHLCEADKKSPREQKIPEYQFIKER